MKKALYAVSCILISFIISCCHAGSTTGRPQDLPKNLIAVYGDSQKGHCAHRKVVNAMLSFEPAMVFHTGDLVDNGDRASQWETFNRITGKLRSRAAFYPAPGNHEKNSAFYFNNFDLPGNGRWYAISSGKTGFFVLDSESSLEPGSEQYRWLEENLGKGGFQFTIVIVHRAPFSSSDDGGNETVRNLLCPLFEKYRVSLVFSGHYHTYERSFLRGTHYIVTGGGGGRLEKMSRTNPYRRFFASQHHFCTILVGDKTLTVTAHDTSGGTIDRFEVRPGNAAPR
ncbi:MAG: metallophosphoesterase family protein [Endomicrobiales bacterium]